MSTETGRRAEQTAADYLQAQGYLILGRNWRTRWCEIDIIASRGQAVFFVEVKYRASDRQGSGLDYITHQKLQQMHFAAEFWLSRFGCDNHDYYLSALEVSGPHFAITAWVDDL